MALLHGLAGMRVVEFSDEIAGPYASKLFVDAGADVVKVEGPDGDPLRRWSATGGDLDGRDSALFRFLNAGKRSVIAAPDSEDARELIASADLVIESWGPDAPVDREGLRAADPGLVWLSLSPYGLTGPYANRPATEFTVQADCGSIGGRGIPGQEPYMCGGRIGEWVLGSFSSSAALSAVLRARRSGHGEHIDVSMHAAMTMATTTYADLMWSLLGRPEATGSSQNVETPSIEPTADSYVGFNTNTAQQFSDFLLMIERPELREGGEWTSPAQRMGQLDEWESIVHAWTREHTTAEIVELASVLRIPVAPVCNGETVLGQEQLVAREVYAEDASGGFQRPRAPYRIDDRGPELAAPAPALGEHTGRVEARTPERPAPSGAPELPLAGLRVVDATTWWAGPTGGQVLAHLGADTIHIESTQKPDGCRAVGFMFDNGRGNPLECSTFFLSANANKRGITLNLQDERGREALWKLIESADVFIENFTPRVMDGFGITREAIRERNPRCVFTRMPAFGLDGPWRDNPGFAQTMEQMSGMAWLTGHPADHPRIQRGPCDPLAGHHAAWGTLLALAEREQTGVGGFVESTMVETALNCAAEQVVEWTAYGNLLEREGNRGPTAAPQGLYPCAGHDTAMSPRWLALAIETPAQWDALLDWLGRPAWADAHRGATLAERRERHDEIDKHLRNAFATRELADTVEALVALGIPAAPVVDGRTTSEHPQLVATGFFESVEHPVVGALPIMAPPFRFASVDRWLRCPAPTLGQHNAEVLAELGYSEGEIEALAEAAVIGTEAKLG